MGGTTIVVTHDSDVVRKANTRLLGSLLDNVAAQGILDISNINSITEKEKYSKEKYSEEATEEMGKQGNDSDQNTGEASSKGKASSKT